PDVGRPAAQRVDVAGRVGHGVLLHRGQADVAAEAFAAGGLVADVGVLTELDQAAHRRREPGGGVFAARHRLVLELAHQAGDAEVAPVGAAGPAGGDVGHRVVAGDHARRAAERLHRGFRVFN